MSVIVNNNLKRDSPIHISSWSPKSSTPRSISPHSNSRRSMRSPRCSSPSRERRCVSPSENRSGPSPSGEAIYYKYIDIIDSPSLTFTKEKDAEPPEHPFDFCDDEDFAFGINLLNNNVACVGDNITKLVQMAQEPWPDNVKLFQPYEVEQILLPDNASCLAVQAFLKMCNLPFEVEMRWNAEFMSPSGRVPFIKCGAFVVSELEPIVQFAANKGVSLCGRLSTEEKAEMRAYMSLITNVLVNAELYISWVDNDTFNAVTKVRNSSVYPWPLGWLQTRAKRNSVIKRLKALHWYDKTLEQVLADVEQCCNSLSQRLGDKDYFFGSTGTPLDARLYGHIRALLSAQGPKAALMIKPITSSLLRHMLRMANATKMKLTPQEEYLIYQAFRIVPRFSERGSSERSIRSRSRVCVRSSRDSFYSRDRDNGECGFKPFASKQLIIITSKDGTITCKSSKSDQDHIFIQEINDVILNKVFEIIDSKADSIEQHDFEIIAYPNNIDSKFNDYLDTIAENDVSDTFASISGFNEDFGDSDGLINDKHLSCKMSDKDKCDCVSDDTGTRPTELDALVFGHVFTIITTRLPCRKLAETVRKFDSLVALAKRVDEQYFKRP